MHRRPYPHVSGQRILANLLILSAAMGYRRWLCRPWQLTLGHYMVLVAGSAMGFVIFSLPHPLAIFLLTLGLVVFGTVRLRWHGFKLADIAMLLAIVLLTIAILLPAMRETSYRTAGRRFFPFAVPQHYVELLYGQD